MTTSVVEVEEESQQQGNEGEEESQQHHLQREPDDSTSPNTSESASRSTPWSVIYTILHYDKLFLSLHSPRKRVRRPATPDYDLEKEILKELKKDPVPADEDDLFGQSVGASLKMSAQQKCLAKLKIQQVMYDIQYCDSNMQSASYFPPSDNPMY